MCLGLSLRLGSSQDLQEGNGPENSLSRQSPIPGIYGVSMQRQWSVEETLPRNSVSCIFFVLEILVHAGR
jgi:hypothetical protein